MNLPFLKNMQPSEDLFIIAGLGNPGAKYVHTRHNMGFDAIDVIAGRNHIVLNRKKFSGIFGRGQIAGRGVLLVKPQTFMNNSGQCLGQMVRYYKCDPTQRLIVICDDIHLEPGHIRIRAKGSAGGHNGLKDIIAQTGTQDFARIRIGVGGSFAQGEQIGHVLGHLPQEERKNIEEALSHAADAADLIVGGRMNEAMNRFNRKEKA